MQNSLYARTNGSLLETTMWIALATTVTSMATSPDTFSDEFSSYTSASCDAAWTDDCLTAWDTNADDDSLSMAYCLTQNSNNDYGAILNGGSSQNGISKTYDVTSRDDGWLTASVKTFALSAEITATLRIQLMNSSLTVLRTITEDINTVDEGSVFNIVYAEIDNTNVEYIRISFGATGSTELWIDEMDLVYYDAADGDPPTTSAECIALCECPDGYTKTGCSYTWQNPPPKCDVEVKCSPNNSVDEPDETTSSWTTF